MEKLKIKIPLRMAAAMIGIDYTTLVRWIGQEGKPQPCEIRGAVAKRRYYDIYEIEEFAKTWRVEI